VGREKPAVGLRIGGEIDGEFNGEEIGSETEGEKSRLGIGLQTFGFASPLDPIFQFIVYLKC
jgi:hypothetical protein